MIEKESKIKVENLEMRYGSLLIQRNLNFEIMKGEVFVIMGGSGCGKSTLLRHLIGLKEPALGSVKFGEIDFWKSDYDNRVALQKKFGVLYQSGALWSSMTLEENVSLPIEKYTDLSSSEIRELVSLKLSLVGLALSWQRN